MKLASLHLSLPGSELQGHAYLLQVQLEHPRPIEAELEGEATAVSDDNLQSVRRPGSLQGSGVFPGFDRHRGSQLLE